MRTKTHINQNTIKLEQSTVQIKLKLMKAEILESSMKLYFDQNITLIVLYYYRMEDVGM